MGSLSGVLIALSGVKELFSGVLAGDFGDTDCSWVTLYMKPGCKNLDNDRDKKNPEYYNDMSYSFERMCPVKLRLL